MERPKVFILNGKEPDEPYNAVLGFWLPPDSPYGNLQLKYMKIILRLDEANRKIADSLHFWGACQGGGMLPIGAFERHIFSNEGAVYMLRRAADELVSLVWLLSKYEADNKYPRSIKIDCLGAVISQGESNRHEAYAEHVELMKVLNDIANAFKHSFVNSDQTMVGAREPRIHALGLEYNKLSSGPRLYDVSISELTGKFNAFYQSCVSWLSAYSARNR